MAINCVFCKQEILNEANGEPYLIFKNTYVCTGCAINLIPLIYRLNGTGNIQHFIFRDCLEGEYNRTRRISLQRNKDLFRRLLHKYNFECKKCKCRDKKKLTIDHIMPFSKGGSDDYSNLQILCKSCNSKKGAKIEH